MKFRIQIVTTITREGIVEANSLDKAFELAEDSLPITDEDVQYNNIGEEGDPDLED